MQQLFFSFCFILSTQLILTQPIYYRYQNHEQVAFAASNLSVASSETLFNSPTLASVENAGLAVMGTNPYLTNNMLDVRLMGWKNTKQVAVGGIIYSEQTPSLNTYEYTFVSAKNIRPYWNMGAKFTFFQLNFKGVVPNKNAYYFEWRNQFLLTPNWNINVQVFNPIGGDLDLLTKEKIPRVLSISTSYTYKTFAVQGGLVKEENKTPYLSASIFTAIGKQFFAGFGYLGDYQRTWFYTKYQTSKKTNLIGTLHYHPYLGFSPSLGFEYLF